MAQASRIYQLAQRGDHLDSLIIELEMIADLDTEGGYWNDYAVHAQWLGELYQKAEQPTDALHWYQEEYEHRDDLKQQGVPANLHVHRSMARNYLRWHNEADAITSLAQCKVDLNTSGLDPTIAREYFSLYGDVLSSIGYHRDACEMYWTTDSLLKIEQRTKNEDGLTGLVRSNTIKLAITHLELGDQTTAIDLARQALRVELEDPYTESAYKVLSRCYSELAPDSAKWFREQAQRIALRRTDADSKGLGDAKYDAAWAAYQRGAWKESLVLLEETINLQNANGHRDRMAFCLGLRGVLLAASDSSQAEGSALAALRILTGRVCGRDDQLPEVEAFPDPVKAIPVLSFRSAMYEALDKERPDDRMYLAAAVRSADLALALLERAGRSRNEAERANLAAERWSAFEGVVRINALAYKRAGGSAPGFAEQAFKAMELSKNFLAKGGGSACIDGAVDPLTVLELRIVRLTSELERAAPPVKVERKRRGRKQAKEPVSSGRSLDQQPDLAPLLAALILERDSIITARETKAPAWVLPTIGQIQSALPEREILVEYFSEKEKLYAIWIDNDSLLFYSEDKMKKGLLPSINECVSGMKARGSREETSDASMEVYNFLLRKGLDRFDPPSLVVIPDGELCRIPFEALEFKEGHVLLEQRAVRYGYSANVVLPSTTGGTSLGNSYLGCAPVQFDTQGSSARLIAEAANGGMLMAMRSRDLSDSLPNTKREVTAGFDLFGGLTLINAQASEVNVRARMNESRIIHFATHGFVNMLRPEYSGLLLADHHVRKPRLGELLDDPTDNVLYAHEISRMHLNADLVVLSACQTGDGAYRHGEGVMSLARAFEDAGVRNVVMSLWPVQDASTATIMEDFLSLVKDGEPKHEALRRAKLNFRDTHAAADVNSWAPFVLIGDGKPLPMNTRSPIRLWMLGGGAAIILAATIALRRRRSRQAA